MILVTGATGFIGRSLMARLEREGVDARPYDGRLITHLKLREQLQGIHTVVHLAGAENRGQNRLLQHVDVEGTAQLIDECRRAGVQHLVVPSHLGANTAAMHPLLRAKGEVEQLIRRSGIPYTILQTAPLYGRNDRFTEIFLALAIWSFPFVWLPGGGHMPVQPLWVEDYARCLHIILQQPDRYVNQTVAIAGEERMTHREMMQRLLTVNGRKRLMLPLPMVLVRPSARFLFSWWYWPPLTPYAIDRFFVPAIAEPGTVLRHFGFQPAQFNGQIVYLRRPGLPWRLFRR
ncbi:MAG: NAD-dependent epimerase/dehydratase family protein [Chloroflexi bacterium]|nr:NAD-dependent epimerase/dehydratase family protein [Ardenticatenaceae bacterium]MBL1131405.1 NAD-dependent epimerase/dehydratase family protein [Chloroflexota bacterium]NOG37512.1 NAD-dependent epimerase/dehydratase family protein [Chloroflexota bacterium]